jgi:hypothetical protein
MYNKNYLSKRPFLVINTKFLPGPGARTANKDWADQSGWNVVEEISIVDRVMTKHQTYATLIVDILEGKCVKNGFSNAAPEDAMAFYLDKYRSQIKEAVGVWLEREAQKLALTKVRDIKTARDEVRDALNSTIAEDVVAEVVAEEANATEAATSDVVEDTKSE